ncbi:hypothetical protein LXL04_030683 [Taraxacum kok-saghyz]
MLVQVRTIIKFENGGTNLDRYKSHTAALRRQKIDLRQTGISGLDSDEFDDGRGLYIKHIMKKTNGMKWGGEGAGSVIPVPVPEFLTLSPSPSPSPTDAGNQIPTPLDFGLFPGPSPVHPQPIPDPQT